VSYRNETIFQKGPTLRLMHKTSYSKINIQSIISISYLGSKITNENRINGEVKSI
jgi:hypothetical protein